MTSVVALSSFTRARTLIMTKHGATARIGQMTPSSFGPNGVQSGAPNGGNFFLDLFGNIRVGKQKFLWKRDICMALCLERYYDLALWNSQWMQMSICLCSIEGSHQDRRTDSNIQ